MNKIKQGIINLIADKIDEQYVEIPNGSSLFTELCEYSHVIHCGSQFFKVTLT